MSGKQDLIIIGGGPSGIACAIEASRRDLKFHLLEKGCIVNSIYNFPADMTFFTTGELLEIGDVPMIVAAEKPGRAEGFQYYRRVVEHFDLPVRDYELVTSVNREEEGFRVESRHNSGEKFVYYCKRVIVATGYYDNPNLLDIPGENLSKVSHYYTDCHPYYGKKVAVVGGKNSAAQIALDLFRNANAEVTFIYRGDKMRPQVKYWVLPDINNRISRSEVIAYFSSEVKEIREKEIVISTPEGEQTLENDFVFAMTGYHPDVGFLRKMGINIDPETYIPEHNPDTLETNVSGIYLAGAIVSGKMTNRIFIENGRFHGEQIFRYWDQENWLTINTDKKTAAGV